MIELLGHGWHVNLQKPMCNTLEDAQRMLDAAAANDRVLRVMENYLFYEPLRELKAVAESGELGDDQRLPHEDGRQRSRRLGRPDEQLRVAVPADAARPRHPRVRRRVAQAGDGTLAVRPVGRGAGVDRRHRGRTPASRSTHPPRSLGSTRAASAACGTSRSRPTSTSGPTTTPTTSGGRSPGARASPA